MSLVTKTIGELAVAIKTGKTPPTKNAAYFGGEISWYTPGDLDGTVYLGESKRTITDLAVADKKAVMFDRETVLLSCIGDVGKIGLTTKLSSSNQQITGIKLNSEINPLYFLLWCKKNKSHFERNAKKAVVPILNNAVLSRVKVQFPESVDEQIRIATLLSRVKALIATRKNNLQQLGVFLKSTFLEMFGDPVRNEKGWEKKPLSVLGALDRGVSKHRPRNAPELLGGRYPLIQTGEVTNSGTYITGYKHTYSEVGFKQSKLWPGGTLCITIAANIAQTSILTFDACFPDSVVGFIADKNESDVLFVHVLFGFFQKILEENAPKAAQKNINLAILRNLLVPAPPVSMQREFAIFVRKTEHLKNLYQQNLAEIENLYGVLSQKAFKGELDLSYVPLPEKPEPIARDGRSAGQVAVGKEVTRMVEYPMSDPDEREKLLHSLLDNYLKEQQGKRLSLDDFWQQADFKVLDELDESDQPWGVKDYDQVKDWLFELIREGKLEQAFVEDSGEIRDSQIELTVKG